MNNINNIPYWVSLRALLKRMNESMQEICVNSFLPHWFQTSVVITIWFNVSNVNEHAIVLQSSC